MYERDQKEAAIKKTHEVGRSLLPLDSSAQYVPGNGDVLSRVVLIGEAPGSEEDRAGKPFVGRAGKELNTALEIHGIPREAVYTTYVVKKRSPGNRRPTDEEIYDWFPVLDHEVKVIDPVAVLLLGATALKAVTGSTHITSARGRVLECNWPWLVMATYDPLLILNGGFSRDEWYRDFENFFEQALTFVLPHER